VLLYNQTRSNRGHYEPNITFHLLEDLAKGKVIFGTMFREFSFLSRMIDEGDDPIKEVRESGYRFLIIDCEHKAFNAETLAEFAARAHDGVPAFVKFFLSSPKLFSYPYLPITANANWRIF